MVTTQLAEEIAQEIYNKYLQKTEFCTSFTIAKKQQELFLGDVLEINHNNIIKKYVISSKKKSKDDRDNLYDYEVERVLNKKEKEQ